MRQHLLTVIRGFWSISVLLAAVLPVNAEIVYVKSTATGANNGSSWIDAYTNLQSALVPGVPGDSIWVAAGTYKPTSTNDRTATFQLKSGVTLWGGFTGIETDLDERNWTANSTILSGRIVGPLDSANASYHVVVGSGADSTAVLDGFVVFGGNADGIGENEMNGGGCYISSGSPTITNVTFSGNRASQGGGGMYNAGTPKITNAVFKNNNSNLVGGGMFNEGYATIFNVTFENNSAGMSAGGMFNGGYTDNRFKITNAIFKRNTAMQGGGLQNGYSRGTFINVMFYRNTASYRGGGLHLSDCFVYDHWSPTLVNCTFNGNVAGDGGGGIFVGDNSGGGATIVNTIMWGDSAAGADEIGQDYLYLPTLPAISYSLVKGCGGSGAGWNSGIGSDGGHNIDSDPLFVNASSGDLRLWAGSAAINAGNNGVFGLPLTDLAGGTRVLSGTVDMGAYETDLGLMIQWIADVGNDQGRLVRISFTASVADVYETPFPVIQYEAFRRYDLFSSDPTGATSFPRANVSSATGDRELSQVSELIPGWEFVGAVPAHGESAYLMIAPTLADSTIVAGMRWSVYFIRAATAIPTVFFDSLADSGYSLDNLSPAAPSDLTFTPPALLSWNDVSEPDFDYFSVFGSVSGAFDNSAVLITHTTATSIDVTSSPFPYYFVTATDFSGNEGQPASIDVATGVGRTPRVMAFALEAYPNPFNPGATVEFTLEENCVASVCIYDISGRLVRTLVNGRRNAGMHSEAWDGRGNNGSPVASGVYVCRLDAGDKTLTKKLVCLK